MGDILENVQKASARVSFLIKLQAASATLLKRDSGTEVIIITNGHWQWSWKWKMDHIDTTKIDLELDMNTNILNKNRVSV